MTNNDQVDLVLLNGKIITVDSKDTIAEAVAVNDGKIVMVGASSEIRSLVGEDTELIDLEGRTVVPGFIDSHVHIDITAATTKLAESCYIPKVKYVETTGSVSSTSDILNKIKGRVAGTQKGEWIFGKGRLEQPYPTREQLDEVAPDHPVMIHCSGHTQILNSMALEKSGITRDRPTQEELERFAAGGRIWRDPETGEPTGVLTECWDWVFPIHCPWPYKELKEAIKKTLDEAIRFGVTTINEFLSWPESTRIYQELLRSGELPIRVQLCPCVWGLHRTIDLDCLVKLGFKSGFGNEWLKFGSAKIFTDVRGRFPRGVDQQWDRLTQEKLNELVSKAHNAGIRVMMHSTNRSGHNLALNAVKAALEETPKKDHRHRIEHFGGDYWQPEYERLKKLGVIPVPTPYSSYGWYGDAWLESAKPGEKVVYYRTMLDDGLKPPGNSDCMGTEPEALNPWWSIWCMVARKSKSGKLISPEQGVTVMEAIRIYTMNSAYSIFEEECKGSIEPGKFADMAILKEDPLTVPVDRLKEIEVDATIVDGKIAYNRKK